MATRTSRLHRLTVHVLVFSFLADPFALARIQAASAPWKGVAAEDLRTPSPIAAVPAPATATAKGAPASRDGVRRKVAAPFVAPATGPVGLGEAAEACPESLTQHRAPLVSLAKTLLWPPNHPLVDVGLGVNVTAPCEGRVTTRVAVFADEPDEDQTGDGNVRGDARIDGTTLYLRSERKGDADGRVYLVLTTSTLPDGTAGTACATVVVPRSRSQADLASVSAQAGAAQAYCDAHQAPPPSFFELTEGVLTLANIPPVVNAGPDQAVDFPGSAVLRGTATDDGRPNGTLSVSWSKVDGPAGGAVTFSSPGTAETTASFSATGTYTLRLTANDGQFTASDDAVVVVAVANEAPQVDAGADQEITLPQATVTLDGSATDDGRPVGSTLTATWSVLSPAGAAVTFADAHAARTTATLPGAGEYVLRLTADDGQFAVSDDARITVHAQPPPVLGIEDAAAAEGHEGTTAAVVTLALSYAWSQPVTVDYLTEDGTAVAGCDYRTAFGTVTFAPGETTAEILVPIAGELAPEEDETVGIRVGNVSQATLARTEATLTILNDDAASSPPDALSNRSPADRANSVALPPTLTWSAVDPDAGDVLTHDVHLGTSFATSGQSWTRTCPANQGPGPRTAPVAGYDEAGDRLILFGGVGATDDSLWILDNASAAGGPSRWTSIPTTGGPVGLGRAAAVYDAATNRLFVVGGCDGDCAQGSDQTWILTNANGVGGPPTWSPLAGAGPGPRMDHAAAIDPATRRLIVFGGSSAGASLGDVWLLNLDGPPAWQALPVGGTGPARSGMTASYDGERNVLVVFGGRAGTQALSDTWVLGNANGSGGGAVWSRLAPAGTPPPARWGHVAAYDPVSARLVVYGGSTASANPASRFVFRDVWMLTDAAGVGAPEWIRLSPNAGPAGQAQAAGAFSASANRMAVLGGASSTAPATDEVWVLSDAIGTLPLVSSDTATSLTPVGLTPGAVYYWRVVSRDDHGAARGSTAWRFTSNAPPSVEAGPDQEITLPASVVTLNGMGTDDGLPAGALTFTWTASGPGLVTFADASLAVTTATFTAPGTYVLRLTVSDSRLSASDELTVTVLSEPAAGRTWTTTADFAAGQSLHVNGGGDQVQLDETAGAYPFVWIAVSSKGTIVKIDARTGAILGEYFSSPAGQPRNPSRTTVDLDGNVWTANRDGNSIVHIGNEENKQCVDRNGNGVIDTSRGFGDLRPWTNTGGADTDGGISTAADECILHYTRVSARGTRHLSITKDNDVWVSGKDGSVSQPFDLVDGRTGLIKRSEPSVGYGGYGGLIDRNGVIWSARPLLRWDPRLPLAGPNGGNWRGLAPIDSYGLCIDPQGNVWETYLEGPTTGNPATSGILRKWAADGTLLGTFGHGFARAQGCAVDARGDVWVAHTLDSSVTVGHVKNNGAFVGNVTLPSGVTGVAVDLHGKIWTSNHNSRNVSRIDPNAGPIGADGVTRVGAVDFTTPDLGGIPYNYSDMTGSTLVGAPREGRWSVVFDSGLAGAKWGLIRWNESRCGDGSLSVRVASSLDGLTFTADQPAASGQRVPVPDGRYLRVTVTFTRATTGESPVLYDLSVGTEAFTVPGDDADQPPRVDAGPDQSVETPNEASLNVSACDDGRPAGALDVSWSKVSGPGDVRFSDPAQPQTRARFEAAGSFDAVEDFSGTQNPSGPWSYGWKPTRTGTFTPGVPSMYYGMPGWLRAKVPDPNGLPVVAQGPRGQTYSFGGSVLLPADLLDVHPGPTGQNAVVRWTAPAAGSYRIDGRFQGISTANPTVDVAILHNATAVFTGNITSFGQATPFSLVRNVVAGDVLDFSVGFGNGNFNNDSTGLAVRVTPVDAAGVAGTYVLRLSASDSVGSAQDEVAVTVATPECVAPLAGTVGWWPADGLATDLFGGPAGTLAGGMGYGAGMVGQAFFFDGVDDAVTLPASPALNVQALTLEGWIFPTNPRVRQPIFEYGFAGEGIHLWHNVNTAIVDTPGALYANLIDAGGTFHILATGAGVLVPSTWNHVAVTYDPASGKARLYANGRLQVEHGVGTFVPKTNLPFNIGHRPTTSFRFAGGIDEATIVGRALTAAEIQEIYFAGALGKCKDSINLPPRVDAGPDRTATLRCDGKAVATLQGSVTDDGRPAGATLTTTWSSVSGPGTVTFSTPNAATTTATFPAAGDYTLRLTGSDSQLAAQDVAVVRVSGFLPPSGSFVASGTLPSHNGQNGPAPVTVSGLTVGRTYSLYLWGSWAYGNGVIGKGTQGETLVSGFGNPVILLTSTTSPFTSTAPLAVRRFEATATAVTMAIQDQVNFYSDNVGQLFFQIYEGVPGEPLVVNAGPDRTLTQPVGPVALTASVTDAGLPPVTPPTFLWTQVSGPPVAIASPASATTSVTLSQVGTYVFRIQATSCVRSVQDEVTLVVVARPDLSPTSVDVSGLTVDGQTLAAGGTVSVQVTNGGGAAGAFDVTFFEDRDGDGVLDPAADGLLGTAAIASLGAGETTTAAAAVSGGVQFAGSPVHVLVDSGRTVAETDESNNYAQSGPPCENASGSKPFAPRLEWSWTSSANIPASVQVMMAPVVVDLDGDRIPEVIFNTFADNYLVDGHLRAVSGATGQELFTVTNPLYDIDAAASPAVGDIDGDGRPEIVTIHETSKLIAFEHDGTFKWFSDAIEAQSGFQYGGPALADLDGDGTPEIVIGRQAFNANGTRRWSGTAGRGDNIGQGSLSIVADLDLDGTPEVIAGNTAYRAAGTIYWQNTTVGDGFTATGNFDADPNPEIVVVSGGRLWLLEHTGAIKWGPVGLPGGGFGGAPVVADIDADGQPEIGVAGSSRYSVFKTDGSVKWSSPTHDISSQMTGSSVFDFEADGSAEVIYADELKLRVYRGTDGTILWEVPRPSQTTYDLPVVADVDGDGHAEILTVHDDHVARNWGVRVYGDDNWVATRRIWNQHSYHITNVNDDGTIPPRETNSWTKYNSYRQNRLTGGCEFAKPDLTASFVRSAESDGSLVLTARIGNGGGSTVAAGVPVSFYDRDPATVGTRIATVATSSALAPGQFVDVSVTVPATTVARPLWVVADDQGGLVGTIAEFDETNNAYNSRLFLSPTGNTAPAVDAGPDQRLVHPQRTAVLDGTATDDGQPLGELTTQWTVLQGPVGAAVTFADSTAVDTSAMFSAAGAYVLRLTADDSQSTGSDDVTIVVEPANQAPVVDAGPNQSITKQTTALDGTVTDDGLPTGGVVAVQWSKLQGPGAAVFTDASAVDTTATFGQEGRYVLQLSASDSVADGSDTVEIDVAFANNAPVVDAGPNRALTLPANALTLTGTATDDGLPLGSTLSVQWSAVVSPGVVTFAAPAALETTATFSDPGVYVLKLTASDGTAKGSDQVQVTVGAAAPSGNPPAVAPLAAPLDGARVTSPISVVGSATSDSLASWKLEYRLEGDTTYTRFAAGTTPVIGSPLGTFDPSLLLNGIYEVRLTATDTAGRNSHTSVKVVVKDNLKVGHFTVSFVDLDVPVAGLPMQVTRTYDSRDKGKGDFGIGWRLEMSNVRLAEKGVVGEAFEGTRSSGPFPTYCLQPIRPQVVTVTLTDGTVYEFQPVLTRSCQQFVPPEDATVTYQPLPGTHASLAAAGDGYVFVVGSWPGPMELYDASLFYIYDPDDYVLTLADGTQLFLNQATGLKQVKDLNGNTLTVSSSGITHSSGRGIAFSRDAQGRITRVTDPDNHSMTYGYDAAGDLVSFTDRETHTTTFTYNPDQPHLLETIKDPRGKQPIRNEYYDDGRIKSHTDAFGKTITYAHDLTGRQEVVTDRDGGVRVLAYDERGNVVRETDPEGKVVDRTFDARNNRLTETLPHDPGVPNPPKTTYFYDAQDDLRSVTDPENNTTEYTYNVRKQIVLMKDPRGTYTLNAYDAKGNLFSTKTSTSPTGSPVLSEVSSTYRADGNLETHTEVVDGVACVTRYEYDGSGRLIKETDGLGHEMSYTYDASGNRLTQSTTRTTPNGVETLTTTYEYDKLGRLLKTTDPDTTFTRTVYDEVGRQKESHDKLGRVTKYEYDDMGRLVLSTYPDLTTEQTTYDGEGHRLTFKNRAGRVTKFTYDKLGRRTKTTYPDETFTENVYDSAGRLKETKDARGNTTFYGYDAAGRRTSVKVPLGGGAFAETVFTYDANGNQKTVRDANLHAVTYEYDEHNRQTKTILPDGTYTETIYDMLGRRQAERDQAGKLTKFDYDCLGRLTTVTQSNEGVDLVTHYEYDEVGNRILQRDANGHETRFEYDELGRETARTLPDGKTETKTYWPTGSLKTRTDFMGRTTSYEYDENERLTTQIYPAGTLPAVSFTYTPTGQRKTVTVAGATTQYEYDLSDRLQTLSYPDGRTLEYDFDGNGNRTMLRATVGGQTLTLSFSYDAANRLDLVTDPASRAYDHDYDPAGNRQALAYPNGVRTTYNYDDLNRLRNLATTHPATGVTIQSYGFTLGPAGNRTRIAEGDGTVLEYGYDDLYRLTSEKVTIGALPQYEKAYTYDAAGNRLTQATNGAGAAGTPVSAGTLTYVYDTRDRLETESGTQAGEPVGITYSYDDNGNLITKSGEATYFWDVENRLARVETGPLGSMSVVTYAYDADGNRLQTKITPPTGPPTVTNYLIDTSDSLSHVVAETDDGGLLKAYYVRGDDLLAVMRPTGITRFVHSDGVGSIRKLTDETGATNDSYSFSAFGELVSHDGSDPNSFLFAGEPLDAATQLYHLRARWMDPAVGLFLSVDPWEGSPEEPVTLHRYLYAGNDPINRVDPSGEGFFEVSDPVFGTKVHNKVAEIFGCASGPAGRSLRRLCNREINTILRAAGATGYGVRIPFKPDLANLDTKEIYEIKPLLGAISGFGQLAIYLTALSSLDSGWDVGSAQNFRTPPSIIVEGRRVVLTPPLSGLIIYTVPERNRNILTVTGAVLVVGEAARFALQSLTIQINAVAGLRLAF